MNQIICDAINNRKILMFTYHTHPRVIQPHAYGLSLRRHEVIRGYQVGGTSGSGRIPCWRLFEVNEIIALIVTQEHFLSEANGYARGDKDISTIFCEL
ncbi:MAG: hypothetical protein JW845_07330 [Dehalococcoidales bacterium]|nr:hypothetical protein [Dehalococcoidales bacterium]